MSYKTLTDLGDLSGKRVLLRVDWNVPIQNGAVVDDFRIRQSIPTIERLRALGANLLIASHLDPDTASLEPVYEQAKTVVAGLSWNDDGPCALIENLRENPGEKANDPLFAESLADLADLYVNEAFSVSHRAHASIVGVPHYIPGYAGLEFDREVKELSAFFAPSHPFLFILGGAKFETKMPLVQKFLTLADEIVIMGANAKPAHDTDLVHNSKISFPLGDIAALDADEANIARLKEKIASAALVLWNGPLGKYEDGYTEGTQKLAEVLAASGKKVVVGGGDTLAAIRERNLLDKFAFVSTGGGAMLDFLANETLPGIEALS